jgi:hypothetical protein
MRTIIVCGALMAACSGEAETAAEAARRFVAAYNRGDSGAIYDLLVESERTAWEEVVPSLPGGPEAPGSPRKKFASMIEQLWGDNRGSVELLRVDASGDRGRATIKQGDKELGLSLVREGGAWWVSLGLQK